MLYTSQNPDAGVGILSDAELRDLLDHLPGTACRYRWDGDWNVEFVSRGIVSLTGFPPADLIENSVASWSRLIHDVDLPAVVRRIRDAVEDRKPFQIEYRLILPGEKVKWVREGGRIVSPSGADPCTIESYIVDISEQKTQEADSRSEQEQARSAIENSRDAFLSVDRDGTIRDWNRQAEQTFGWSRTEVIGRGAADILVPSELREQFQETFAALLETQVRHMVFQNVDLKALRRDGGEFPVALTVWPSRKNDALLFNAFVHDLERRRALEQQLASARQALEKLMREDPLTGLANRAALEKDMTRAISFARRWQQPLTLVAAALDGFRALNEELGRRKGDEVLIALAEIVRSSCRLEDVTARLDGSEFALLLPNTDLAQARIVRDRIRTRSRDTAFPSPGVKVRVGVASLAHDDTPDSFLSRAIGNSKLEVGS